MPDCPRICVVLTIRNEEELLRSNILYHHFLGVDRFLLYLDRTTDGGPDSISDLPYVDIVTNPSTEPCQDIDAFEAGKRHCDTRHDSRQVSNVGDAIKRTRAEGFDWLINIDPDELICVSRWRARSNQLKIFFGRLPVEIRTVIFPVWEIVQNRVECGHIFSEATLFRRWVGDLRRMSMDPVSGETFPVRSLYGHSDGKSAVRLGNADDIIPSSLHRFTARDGSALGELRAGFLLHYFCYSLERFITKYQNFKDVSSTWKNGKPKPPHLIVWNNVVNNMGYDREQIRDYYERWVMFSSADIRRWRTWSRRAGMIPWAPPSIKRVYSVRNLFRKLSV